MEMGTSPTVSFGRHQINANLLLDLFNSKAPEKYIFQMLHPPFFSFSGAHNPRTDALIIYIRMQLPDVMGDVMLWADIRLVGNGLNTILLMTSTLRHHPLQWGGLIKCSCTIRIIFARNIIAGEIETNFWRVEITRALWEEHICSVLKQILWPIQYFHRLYGWVGQTGVDRI